MSKNRTKPPITYVLLVTDVSGSMHSLADDVRGGYNAYLDELARSDGRYRVCSTLFNDHCHIMAVDAKLSDVPRLDADNYVPRGTTALHDAIGNTITAFNHRVTPREDERVLVVVQTDGYENSSREWTLDSVRALIGTHEATQRWGFVYLGAGPNAWGQGAALGMHEVKSDHSSYATRSGYQGMSVGTIAYAAGAPIGETVSHVRDAVDDASDDSDADRD